MEILAPCGGPEHVKAAVFAGADAVYLGGRGFSARRKAANFSAEEMRETVRFCHGYGVLVYVTVNILTRDGEWDALREYLLELAGAAPDALIVQDVGVARFCRTILPDLPLHASTQLSVHSLEGVHFCEEAGFSRVVIARECDQMTLQSIVKNARIGIETFIHGALCVSVSGQCGLSAMIGGRSGNRGLCAQPCRLDFEGGGRHYALSLKDLSLVREARMLADMGICAVKIEGRMKRPEYVAAAVRAVKASLAGEEAQLDDLKAAFSREGFTKGYFTGRLDGMGGVRTREDVLAMEAVMPRLAEQARVDEARIPVTMDFQMRRGEPCRLSVSDETDEVTAEGAVPVEALSSGAQMEEVKRLLSRLGGTPFAANEIQAEIEPGLFVPAAQINGLRRDACALLLERRIERNTPRYTVCAEPSESPAPSEQTGQTPFLRVHCQTAAQARTALDGGAEQIVLGMGEAKESSDLPSLLIDPGRFILDEGALTAKLRVLREAGAKHLLCQNPAHVRVGQQLGYTLHGGLGLNVFNSASVSFWAGLGLRDLTASMELRLSECFALRKGIPVGVAAYGHLPLMLLRRCPFEGKHCNGGCPGVLGDRTGRRFPLRCLGGYQELLNADLLWMADQLNQMREMSFLSLLLHEENESETLAVVRAYRDGGKAPPGFTRGALRRGVE